jgi:uncharacterized membrane protein YkvA (DUF1232 family)
MTETSDRPETERTPEARDRDGDGGGRPPQGVGDLVLFLPRLALLLGRLIADPQVATTDKLLLGAVVAYIVSPIDIVPDFIPVIGQIDDVYLVALCLLRLLNRSGEAKVRQYWDGPEDIVAFLHTVTDLATRYLPDPARAALRGWIDARDPGAPRPGGAV